MILTCLPKGIAGLFLYGCAILFSIILFSVNLSYSQLQDLKLNHSTGDLQQDSTNKFKSGFLLSMGAGPNVLGTAFIVSPGITGELHEHINLTTGVDFYFTPKYESNFYVINVIPYYVLRIWEKTIFQIGIGGQFYKGGIFAILSTKFDYEVFHNNYLGIEIKTFVKNMVEGPSFLPLLLTYSIRL